MGRILTAAGEAWSERAGGTSGALWGSAIIAAGQALGNKAGYSGEDAAAAVTAFVAAVFLACLPAALPKPAQTVAPTPTSTARISTRLMFDSFPAVPRPLSR